MTAPLLLGPGLVARRVRVRREDVAWVRWVIEAHDNLASVHVAEGGVVTLVTTHAQLTRVEAVLEDLRREVPITPEPSDER